VVLQREDCTVWGSDTKVKLRGVSVSRKRCVDGGLVLASRKLAPQNWRILTVDVVRVATGRGLGWNSRVDVGTMSGRSRRERSRG